ncbi:MAG: 4-hydroxy-2-oxovalerate aldolase [Deferribacterales bacterium]|jgi:4-hydroxy-2-oxovalerate aldolase
MKPRILDCTLRDGSYAINFQFDAEDTVKIVKGLEDVGIDMIEVGHGVGLGASEKGYGVSAETDETYMKVTSEALKKADWGMFCIPGIASLDDVRMAADYGMKFIRIGTNITDYEQSKEFVELAKKKGMFVCNNFMKSYASSVEDFAKYAKEVAEYGSDLVYVVDSAGGMLPEEVSGYFKAAKELSPDLQLGFHGHNNLGLGIGNALHAMEAGAVVIDSSLQGIGRSAGNTVTEHLVCILMRRGIDMNIDPIALSELGDKYIAPLMMNKVTTSLDIITGLTLFHSSYMGVIQEFAVKYRVDPRKLMVAVTKRDIVNAPRDLVEEEAKKLSETEPGGKWKAIYKHYYGSEQ